MIKIIKCPICEAKGHIRFTVSTNNSQYIKHILDKKRIAKELRNKGLSLRFIAKKLGYNNPQSIIHLLTNSKKK